MANRTDYQSMVASLKEAKALVSHGEKFVITRGTDCTSQQQRCIVVDTKRLNAESTAPVLTLVSNRLDGDAASDI
jgi:hypothetical protein